MEIAQAPNVFVRLFDWELHVEQEVAIKQRNYGHLPTGSCFHIFSM